MTKRAVRLVAIAASMVVGLAGPASANDGLRADKERIDREVAEAAAVLEQATDRAQEAAREYAAANAALPTARDRLGDARAAVAVAQVLADQAADEAESARQRLAEADRRHARAVAEVDQARAGVDAFVVAAYKGSPVAAANLLLDARGPAELINRLGYLDRVAATEQAAVDELLVARLGAQRARNDAELAERKAEDARLAAAAALVEAEEAAVAAEAAAVEAEALVRTSSGALAEAEAERDESLARYEAAEQESDRIAAELTAWEARSGAGAPPPGSSPGGRLAMPIEGWKSSDYGMRFDPFFRVWRLHGGVDIAAAGGTPIHAAAGGTVIRAGWNGGYGNFTCLGHGGGLSTCYAHQSEILVTAGQSVRRGELIGRVGTTGASTGHHLHFEVRVDGAPTDPSPYLPSF